MEDRLISALMSVLTGLTGLMGMPVEDGHSHGSHSHDTENSSIQSSQNYTLGSAHEHALLYMNINGTEEEFTDPKFQLQDPYVHLENRKPHVVHKHSENVTWKYFLDTIDINKNETCLEYKQERTCGNISVTLNGDANEFDTKIQQGDKLIITVPQNRSVINEYMDNSLPRDYRENSPGAQV